MYGVVINSDRDGYGEVYATFGSAEECFAFIRKGGTKGMGKVAVVRNPYADDRDGFGQPCPRRQVVTR